MAKKTPEQVLQDVQELINQLQTAYTAICFETDPKKMLDHVGFVRDQGRIEAFRRILQDRALELFAKAKG